MPAPRAALLTAVVGAVVAFVLGLLTFGVQATVHPDHVPLALVGPPQVAERVTAAAGDQVEWKVVSSAEARDLLSAKEVYGVLELTPAGATVLLSDEVNPSGTQFAQQVLTGVAQGAGVPVKVDAPVVSAAGRTAPLAASALLWIGGMVAGLLLTVLNGRRLRWVSAVTAAVLSVGSVTGLITWWDSALTLDAALIGFLLLVATAFALLQAGLFKVLGIRAVAILGPLYLMAPAVAGQVPELLNPVYRAALWSWTPFRFSTEGVRSLMFGGTVSTELWVFGGIALAGLILLVLPGKKAQPDPADGVVDVGVDQAHRLPGAERQHTA
ncbi:ABC transporter permease [Lentzea tibetensis]|uniref:ABC transporter permease n=1 Tax=Lentzea tibetensis TaxID=2591470 RepID=A0A563ER83_9PSEU|nr:ABC transporter permease [Lentzea tibetensis]TWP50163.1 ABC transporter permease [Lentzea tibetensis]